MDPLQAISPIDGRYRTIGDELTEYFSEMALMGYRIKIEVMYLLALSAHPQIKEVRKFSKTEQEALHALYEDFTLEQARRVKIIEATTKHDVKAIEYFMKERLKNSSLKPVMEFVHFGLTSEDVNNLALSLMLHDAVYDIYVPGVENLIQQLRKQARAYKSVAMLSLTHGQPATPTTLGKELMVYVQRLERQLKTLTTISLTGKFGGATGNWAAQVVAYPQVDWMEFAKQFIASLGLEPNLATTQIESHDRMAEMYQAVARINTVIKDFDQDMWQYISRKLFIQQNKAGEIGSSAMPHKINPIYFENSEGNVGIANALLNHLAEKLPVSRMQRDLTDSTVLRNQGVAISHAVLAVRNTSQALDRVSPDKIHISAELNEHWEVLAEPIQTVMRRLGKEAPYEKLKALTRGHQLTQAALHEFINGLDIPKKEKQQLLSLTPATYIGLSVKVAEL